MRRPGVPTVFFNASVILSGLHSPNGASARLLHGIEKKKIIGSISEVIADEVYRHSEKIGKPKEEVERLVQALFPHLLPAPSASLVQEYSDVVSDPGDAHVLASAKETKATYLVTLDQKHLLAIRNQIKNFIITTPGELLTLLSQKKRLPVRR